MVTNPKNPNKMKHINAEDRTPNETLKKIYEEVMNALGQPMVGMALSNKVGVTLLVEWDAKRGKYITNKGQAIAKDDHPRLMAILQMAIGFIFIDPRAKIHIVGDDGLVQMEIAPTGDMHVSRVDVPNMCTMTGFQRDFKRGPK